MDKLDRIFYTKIIITSAVVAIAVFGLMKEPDESVYATETSFYDANGMALAVIYGAGDISRDYARKVVKYNDETEDEWIVSERWGDIKRLDLAGPNDTGLVISSHAGVSADPNEPKYDGPWIEIDAATKSNIEVEVWPCDCCDEQFGSWKAQQRHMLYDCEVLHPSTTVERRLEVLESRIAALEERPEIHIDPIEFMKDTIPAGCKHQDVSTCCVYGCDGYGCTTCMSCGKTLVAAYIWEYLKEGNQE